MLQLDADHANPKSASAIKLQSLNQGFELSTLDVDKSTPIPASDRQINL